jgi:hypothetical protein
MTGGSKATGGMLATMFSGICRVFAMFVGKMEMSLLEMNDTLIKSRRCSIGYVLADEEIVYVPAE